MKRFFWMGCLLVFALGCVSPTLVEQLMKDVTALKEENAQLKRSVDDLEERMDCLQISATPTPDDTLAAGDPAGEAPSFKATPTPTPEPIPTIEDADALFTKGMNTYHAGDYQEASLVFEQAAVLSESPEFVARCYYWMGECFFAMKSYHRALDFFGRIVDEYPDVSLVPDAKMKIGFTYYEMKDYNMARRVLEEFLNENPDHEAVKNVRKVIQELDALQSAEADSTQHQKESRL